MTNWARILGVISKSQKVVDEVVDTDKLAVNPVVVQPVVTTDTTWAKIQKFYQDHKAKIWGTIWALAAYFGANYVNDAVDNLPVFKDVQAKVTSLESRVSAIEEVLKE